MYSLDQIKALLTQYEAKRAALKLTQVTKKESRTFFSFNRDAIRGYLANPKQNEINIREAARYLKRNSMQFSRLISYYANMIDLKACNVIPNIDLTKEVKPEKVKKSYLKTLVKQDQMLIHTEMIKMLQVCWLEGVSYGYVYDDKNFFIHILDGTYCKIIGMSDGVFQFAFDFSYFSNKEYLLESWAPEFSKKYALYKQDRNYQWQELDSSNSICLKIDTTDPTLAISPFLPLFENLVSLIDLQLIQDAKDAMSIYKLLVMQMDTISGASSPDLFKVNPDTVLAYYDKFLDSVPELVSATISPVPIDVVEFKGTTAEDEDRVSSAMSNLFKASGGSQVLGTDKSGSTIFEAQILADTEEAISTLLPQIQKWVNLYLEHTVGADHAIVKYMEVSTQTKDKRRKALMESGQNGLPVRLAVAALDGFSALDVLRMTALETEILKLQDSFIPFSTSYTQSSDGNKKDASELTDEGSATREKDKNAM